MHGLKVVRAITYLINKHATYFMHFFLILEHCASCQLGLRMATHHRFLQHDAHSLDSEKWALYIPYNKWEERGKQKGEAYLSII